MLTKLALITTITMSLITTAVFGQTAQSPDNGGHTAATKTLTGVVSDSMCRAKHMAKDVEGAWVEIVAAHGARSIDEAIAFVANLKKCGRYHQDVY